MDNTPQQPPLFIEPIPEKDPPPSIAELFPQLQEMTRQQVEDFADYSLKNFEEFDGTEPAFARFIFILECILPRGKVDRQAFEIGIDAVKTCLESYEKFYRDVHGYMDYNEA